MHIFKIYICNKYEHSNFSFDTKCKLFELFGAFACAKDKKLVSNRESKHCMIYLKENHCIIPDTFCLTIIFQTFFCLQ